MRKITNTLLTLTLTLGVNYNVYSQSTKNTSPTVVLGNSHVVALNNYLTKNNQKLENIVIEDSKSNNSDKMRCENCDKFAYEGRTIFNIENELPEVISELKKINSNKVILFEGTNSRWAPDYKIKNSLQNIVNELHNEKIEIYVAEIPGGVEGSASFLTKENISNYNTLIKKVNADGILKTSNIPWDKEELHSKDPNTYTSLLECFKKLND